MIQENPYLRDLNLGHRVLQAPEQLGFERLGDVQHLSNVSILRLPNVGGAGFQRLLEALGRDASRKKI